jgi:hypothetical protein
MTISPDGDGSVRSFGSQRNGAVNLTLGSGQLPYGQLINLIDQEGDGDAASIAQNMHCAKSVSFGTVTTISYRNRTSGDISCLPNDDPLWSEIQQVEKQVMGSSS